MYIYGKNVAYEKLSSGDRIRRIFLSEKFADLKIMSLIKERKVKYQVVREVELNRKVEGLHQGIVLEVDDVRVYDFEEIILNISSEFPTLVLLDHLEDPHNFGAIIRTCEALGVEGIIIPADRSVTVNGTVVKTSVGAIYNIPIIRVANLGVAISKLKKLGYWIVGTDMNGEDYSKIDYKMPVCLVIGNEGSGMSQVVSRQCDFIASIPMAGKVNSLNASVSCGIVLSEIVRQRR